MNLIISTGLFKDRRDLLNESFDALFTELPSSMEDANRALFAEEGQHGVRLRLESRLDVDVAQAFSGIGSFRASDASLVIVFVDRVEVYRLVQE